MPTLRSATSTTGRAMAGARALWRATGTKDDEFGHPIVAIANSFTQFIPGHVGLRDVGMIVAEQVRAAGGVPKEFNTIAVDDGIAMGHDGMLYSLPSRELIADSVEYMVNAHCADALVCISNCDKITPGMLMAAMRLNIPTVFVSGGPMEAGKATLTDGEHKLDLIDAMIAAGDETAADSDVEIMEANACPTCGSCSGMFTANSMNCLTEALGLSLPGNGSLLATHSDRRKLFETAGRTVASLAKRWYDEDDASVLPRSIATKAAFNNAMSLDIAMGGSTNTVLHLLAAAQEGEVDFTMADIDSLSRKVPHLCKVAPSTPMFHVEDVHRAGGVLSILAELDRGGLLDTATSTVWSPDGSPTTMAVEIASHDLMSAPGEDVRTLYAAAPGGVRTTEMFSQSSRWESLDTDRTNGCIRDIAHAYSADGGLAVLFGNIAERGRRRRRVNPHLLGACRRLRVPRRRRHRHPGQGGQGRGRRHHPPRGPQGWPRYAGDVVPDELPEVDAPGQGVRPAHRRPVLRWHVGPVNRSRLPRGRLRWSHRPGPRRGHHQHRHPQPHHQP